MHPKRKPFWLVAGIVFLLLLAGIWRGTHPRPTKPGVDRSRATPRIHRDADPEAFQRYTEYEAWAREQDQGPWALARLAEAYENQWIEWWDTLRNASNPWTVASQLRFESISLPANPAEPPSRVLAQGIRQWKRSRTSAAEEIQSLGQWRRQLTHWAGAGWHIDGSEWRLHAFQPPTGTEPAKGTWRFEIHLEQTAPRPEAKTRRAIVRGVLVSIWKLPPPGGSVPALDRIEVQEWTCLERDGNPLFELVAREDVPPLPGAITIDPLIVHDLDGDGLDEVLLVGRNRVYQNQGGGRLVGKRLCPRLDSVLISAVVADFDGDGVADLLGVDGEGLVLFRGQGMSTFDSVPERQPLPNLQNPFVLTAGDMDGDGHLDLWVAQYKVPYLFGQMPVPYYDALDSFPGYLLKNDGTGRFHDVTVDSGLESKRHRRAYSAAWVDIDGDGRLDLIQVSDFAGIELFLNQGDGRFEDVTDQSLPDPWLFGMALAIADFNGSNYPDVFAIGMHSPVADRLDSMNLGIPGMEQHRQFRSRMAYGNRLWLNEGQFPLKPAPRQRALMATGWSWGVVVEDFQNSGQLDVYIVNGHKSHASARDYENQFWTHDIHITSETTLDPGLDLYFQSSAGRHYGSGASYGGHQRNQFLIRDPSGEYHEIAWLIGLALPEDYRNVVATDLDRDGRLDLVLTLARFDKNPGQEIRVYRNQGPSGNGCSLRLVGSRPGKHPWGARIELHSGDTIQNRWLVTGHSYRSQSPPVAWFGLPEGMTPDRFEVIWPNQDRDTIPIPTHSPHVSWPVSP